MVSKLNSRAPSIADLKRRTQKRIPKFAYQYLVGGCNSDQAVARNRHCLDEVALHPAYLSRAKTASLATTALGVQYDAPFGIAPLGLSGLIWPRAAEYHATAAKKANIPYVLSTLASTSIEQAAACAGSNLWFQLYPPKDQEIRLDLMQRARQVGCNNLVVTIDVPVAGRRPNDIKNGLSVPPKITLNSIYQTLLRPSWAMATALNGMPQFANMQPYMNKLSNLEDVANYIRSTLKEPVDLAMLKELRQQWTGNLIVKGQIWLTLDLGQGVTFSSVFVVVENLGVPALLGNWTMLRVGMQIVLKKPDPHILIGAKEGKTARFPIEMETAELISSYLVKYRTSFKSETGFGIPSTSPID